jgi:hypothetical protein
MAFLFYYNRFVEKLVPPLPPAGENHYYSGNTTTLIGRKLIFGKKGY